MKTVKEKAVEQAFIRVMNRLIGSKDAFLSEGNGSEVGQSAIKDVESEMMWRGKKGKEFKAYLVAQSSLFDKFDGDVFRRTVEKVQPCWRRRCGTASLRC